MNTVFVKSAFNASLQDLGRPGSAVVGFPPNGALDQFSFKAANTLAGNKANAVAVEITLGLLHFSVDSPMLIAVTGAQAELLIDGKVQDMWRPVYVDSGEDVSISLEGTELRTYIAFSGRIVADTFMDSCSPDRVAGFAPSLQPGTELEIHEGLSLCQPDSSRRPVFPEIGQPMWRTTAAPISFVKGPEYECFDAEKTTLLDSHYEMTQHTDQVGARLNGRTPQQSRAASTRSRTMPIGAIEIPSAGELLVLNRGRGVTAGYPVLGIVTSAGLDALSQHAPGSTVQFVQVDLQESVNELIQREAWLSHTNTVVQHHYDEFLTPAVLA